MQIDSVDADRLRVLLNSALEALPDGADDMASIDVSALSQDIETFELILSRMPENDLYADVLHHLKRYRVAVLMLACMDMTLSMVTGGGDDA